MRAEKCRVRTNAATRAKIAPMGAPCFSLPMTQAVTNLIWEDVPLAHLPMPKGAMHLMRSLTSGLTQSVLDPNGVFWATMVSAAPQPNFGA